MAETQAVSGSSSAGPQSSTNTQRPLQPGDGAYLAQARAGSSNHQSRPGRGGGGRRRGGRDHHAADSGERPMNGDSEHPIRPSRPRKLVETSPNGVAQKLDEVRISNGETSRRGHGNRRRPGGQANRREGGLDPAAHSFVPASSSQASSSTAPHSRSSSPSTAPHRHSQSHAERHNRFPGRRGGHQAQRTGYEELNGVRPSRREAFDRQSKLTSAADAGGAGTKTAERIERPNLSRRQKEEEKDDWISKLTRGLKSRPFIECPICFNAITPSQPIWSCTPPETQSDQNEPNSTAHVACYTPFHLSCIRDWADRSLTEEKERAINYGKDDEEPTWRCPGCQKRREERVGGYRCFCGRLPTPSTSTDAPHSCGDACSRKRPGCSHPCPLLCHPGPCPPCQVALIVPCPSHHTPLTVKCAAATSNNAALSPVCDEICDRERDCGNREHACEVYQQLCHHGPCAPCDSVETVICYCGSESKEVNCGWHRKDEKQCAKIDEEGKEEHWLGRYACVKPCEQFYDCGFHPCPEKCHPHSLHPLICPMSPAVVTHCPCGATPLSDLPAPPRKVCTASIPTCKSPCPRSRPCGHQCPLTCHSGDCPACHEEVVRPCRCGESMLVVSCDELRDKMAKGEEVTCERVCKALRNCGRHECRRLCCPLAWKTKSKKKRPLDDVEILLEGDDDLHECHLTCGKLLSCGLHTCSKMDHKGPCGRCLEASYDELICHCGRTLIYPPVACGTTINCPYPCQRDPPACGHPRTSHPCHEQPVCPPCPFLTTKPCACGKDLSVKNVRCSQEKVSCGQACGELLECGYHRCEKTCHAPGQCDPCNQVCGKPKRICKHPCTAVCHAPAKCPESDPCQAIVTQTCACGHLQTRTSCGASTSNANSREAVVLKCNSECAVRQRNARLADALGIQPKDKPTEEWATDMRTFSVNNHAFVKMVEGVFADFFKGTRQMMVLPHMPVSKRIFVMSLADSYRLGHELIDNEPNRSVQIRRRVDTRIPHPLLSVAAQPAPTKPVGGLANLRAPAPKPATPSVWGQKPGGSAALLNVPSGHTNGGSLSTTPKLSTRVPSRPPSTTPLPRPPQGVVEGRVGQVDDDDWDASGDEA